MHRLRDVAQGVAGNTANIKVADSLDEVADEARRHARLLGCKRE